VIESGDIFVWDISIDGTASDPGAGSGFSDQLLIDLFTFRLDTQELYFTGLGSVHSELPWLWRSTFHCCDEPGLRVFTVLAGRLVPILRADFN
jgi:hypothetical protein